MNYKESKLSDVIFHNPEVLTVVNRFGIYLGVGDASIAEICHQHGIDPDFFLDMLNTYLNDEYFPEKDLRAYSIAKIIDYLSKTDNYYRQFQLPNIERHFNSLESMSDHDNTNISLLRRFFLEVKQEILARISLNAKSLFPMLLKLEREGADADKVSEALPVLTDDYQRIGDKLSDLLSFFIVHLKGDYDTNLCRAVVSSLSTLERDVRQNNRIIGRLLRPLTLDLLKQNR